MTHIFTKKIFLFTLILVTNNLVSAAEYDFDSRINVITFGVIQKIRR